MGYICESESENEGHAACSVLDSIHTRENIVPGGVMEASFVRWKFHSTCSGMEWPRPQPAPHATAHRTAASLLACTAGTWSAAGTAIACTQSRASRPGSAPCSGGSSGGGAAGGW